MKQHHQNDSSRCGTIAIIGRPNVGKSTLLNHLLQQKISITTRKPQTTRHQILGISTIGRDQIVYVDTPGLQKNPDRDLNRHMNRAVNNALVGVDVVLFVIEAQHWTEADRHVLAVLKSVTVPVLLIINKVDRQGDKLTLLPYLEARAKDFAYHSLVPMSALNSEDCSRLQQLLTGLLPQAEWLFPEDQVTDRSMRFIAAELIREKLMRSLGEELPYSLAVAIDEFTQEEDLITIHAIIWVERAGQKNIVIGHKGSNLRKIGEQARVEMESMFEHKVYLRTWVKVKERWTENARALQQMGLDS